MVLNSYGIPLGAVPVGIARSISCLWITPLAASTMNIDPLIIHLAKTPAEADVHGIATLHWSLCRMRCAGPIEGVVCLSGLIRQGAHCEERIDRR